MANIQRAIKNIVGSLSIKKRNVRAKRIREFENLRNFVVTAENRSCGLFDAEWYNARNPDVAAEGFDPFRHYYVHGYLESRDPGPQFDTNFYRDSNPDIMAAGTNPLIHYLQHGLAEGRPPNPRAVPTMQSQTDQGRSEVRHAIVKEMRFTPGNDAAMLVTHAPSGRLKPHVLPYMRHLNDCAFAVLLVVVVDQPLELRDEETDAASGIIVRDNGGYDFGAWAHAFQLEPALYGARLLIMTNDSIVPTADAKVFGAMIDRVRNNTADIIGLTASHEYGWHMQSYFLGLKPTALSSWAFQHFIRDLRRIDDKDETIRTYEVPFAGLMKAAGLSVSALFMGEFSANPTFFSWRHLIEQGFPFIKLLMLRKEFALVADWPDVLREVQDEWPEVLEKAGFDVALVRASLRAAEISSVPPGPNRGLLVDPERAETITDDHTLRIAYFGPWNYDNGLGSASRELLCALRHTDIRLNAYPVVKPFHIHRLICPAIETIDFSGRPDIAIVHLNPDSWNVLTDEQRAIIQSAKQRIGYFVWETDKLPPAWEQELHSVDRIWTPSQYCADVISVESRVPVDVVRHPVRVPARVSADRETILRRFGIDPARRVILYIFDGASYLVRKNPEALIRAFSASGLATRGWTLILKTKHLYDRPEAGKALAEMVAATASAYILEVSLHADEIMSLIAAADIYASPHCSEGFGLTVAEAMAVGKPVVATDFAGTRDFVNASCAYPVLAHPWTLEEDHGHYLAGHSWARIDEPALTETLVRAAEAIMAGDRSIGAAAKANITRLLSYEAIADEIRVSVAALIVSSAGSVGTAPARRLVVTPPPPPDFAINLNGASRFGQLAPANGVVPVSIAADLSCSEAEVPEGHLNDWLFFAPRDARVGPGAIDFVLGASSKRPDVVLFYADDVATAGNPLDRVRLKPDFNRTLLVAQDYIGAPIIVRRKTLTEVGGLDATMGTAALYDIVLRVAEAGGAIGRITQTLIGFQGERPVADDAARRRALLARPRSRDAEICYSAVPGLLNQRWRFPNADQPAVTIAIPTRGANCDGSNESYVARLLAGITMADWPMDRLTVIVGDDVAGEPNWATRTWPFKLKRIETVRLSGEAFNYAAKMNKLWRVAADEQIILMNDDVFPSDPNWLAALVGFASDGSVGGVGARLYYEDGSIQHAGMFPSLRTIVHAWLNWPVEAKTYQDWALAQREWSVVTGAVFATRRSILDQVGGFDERFSLEFNDVDLCLRIRNLGYRIVFNPDAQFIHAEKASRGETLPPGAEVALFLSRWGRWLDQDPASHPHLAKNRMDLVPAPAREAWYLAR